jgi:hypothetical protein
MIVMGKLIRTLFWSHEAKVPLLRASSCCEGYTYARLNLTLQTSSYNDIKMHARGIMSMGMKSGAKSREISQFTTK